MYIDEAGDFSTVTERSCAAQPVFAIAGVIVAEDRIRALTYGLLDLKREYYPDIIGADGRELDAMEIEIKGDMLRRHLRSSSRGPRRRAVSFTDRALGLLEQHRCRIVAKVYIKGIDDPLPSVPVYSASMQMLAKTFDGWCAEHDGHGVIVADARRVGENRNSSHSLFTQRFGRATPDPYTHITEPPLFGHSNNHAGLQYADTLCSALLFPMACYQYCSGHVDNAHMSERYREVVMRFGDRLNRLRFYTAKPNSAGGIVVSDRLERRPATHLTTVREAGTLARRDV
jgi:hypothetical protein